MKSKTKWILVATRVGAKVYELKNRTRPLKLIHRAEHPEGHKLISELERDRPGRATRVTGQRRVSLSGHGSPRDRVAKKFAKKLASLLEPSAYADKFDELILVAEPRFLGFLKKELGPHSVEKISGILKQDLGGAKVKDLKDHLTSLI